ncbi:MAG: putative DNA-dependent RNA polymerase subunit Rpb3/Rpb11 [Faunusvirus sp.]|jgi:DNA-directed RNA polymerase subunit L|uniref:Putative DNA-dependent RNA polymerase subunit Rpb3/Rpb11 n=1 Tax=Faunusvirus sp. TaxID=2487766 RepID=A0A3G4ZY52_9VIRU|nr:MAG: putative DNA-dependent RNA polymerase subunit Rpb3/Rpb11 [Faunusvirus sp.]
MTTKFDIKLTPLIYNDKHITDTRLELQFKGKHVNYILLNTLRRTILQLVPIYAFDKRYITISKNSSVFNNDEMKDRLSNFPVINIENSVSNLDHVDRLEKQVYDDLIEHETPPEEPIVVMTADNLAATVDEDAITAIDPTKIASITELNMRVDRVNNTDAVLNVTTRDCQFFLNGKLIDNIYPDDILVIQLKPSEYFSSVCIAKLGIALKSDIWTPTSICVHEEINMNEYIFKLEACSQLDEFELIRRACAITNRKIAKIKNIIVNKKYDSSEHKGKIILTSETHTIGNIFTDVLQNHPNILFAGYKQDHQLIAEIQIDYRTNGGKSINVIFDEVTDTITAIFDHIVKEVDHCVKHLKSK